MSERTLPYTLPLLAGGGVILATLLLYWRLGVEDTTRIHQKTELAALALAERVEEELSRHVEAMIRMANRWAMARPARSAWETDATLLVRHEAYQAVEWVDSTLHVRWIVPLEGNEQAQGLDLTFEPRRRSAVTSARDQRETTTSRTIDLVQGKKGFLVVAPIFVLGRFEGAIMGVLRVKALLDPIVANHQFDGYAISIYDGAEQIYVHGPGKGPGFPDTTADVQLDVAGLSWRLQMDPSAALMAAGRSAVPGGTLAAGALVALLLAAAISLAQAARARAEQAEATQRTLEAEIADRRRIERDLHQAREGLEERVRERTMRLEFLVQELDHRVKNTLATVQAIAHQTLRGSTTLPDFGESFSGRLDALARIHTALAETRWKGLPLDQLVELITAPYRTSADSVSIEATSTPVPPNVARALGMALHELATNAAKYGSLSRTGGRVAVSVTITTPPVTAGTQLHLTWEESCGPKVAPPEQWGFGSALIKDALAYELGAAVQLDFKPDGVHCDIRASVTDPPQDP